MDSEDDLDGYAQTSVKRPSVPPPRPTSKSARSTSANPSSSRAGPSKSSSSRHVPSSAIQEQDEDSGADMNGVNGKGSHAARKMVTSASAASAAARGKVKPRKIAEVTEEEDEDDEPAAKRIRSRAAPVAASTISSKLNKEAVELKRRLDEMTRQRDAYAEQFDTLVRQKGTEHELLFQDYKRVTEERARDQSRLIAQLQAQVSQLQEANRKGHNLPLPIMVNPRHAEELEEWEEKEREWRRKQEELQRELADNRAMLLRIREDRPIQPAINGHAPRSGVPPTTPNGKHGGGPTKNSIVVCLYEDLTNLLVTKCTIESGQFGEEHNFVCVLTSHGKSLQFSLRTFRVLKDPPEPKDPYVEKVIYNPLELDKETDKDWVQRLDFLKEQFTFDRSQMNIFLATAHNKMDLPTEENEEDDDAKMEDDD